jgi:tight adherence protein C
MSNGWIALMIAVGGALVAVGRPRRSRLAVHELLGATGDHLGPAHAEANHGRIATIVRGILARLGAPIGSVTSAGLREPLERDIVHAGVGHTVGVEEVLAAQVLGAFAGAGVGALWGIAGWARGALLAAYALCFVCAGAVGPRVMLRRRGAARQRRINAQVPDALDLLTLCVEAGLAFDAALASVSESIPDPLGGELARTVAEMRLGLSRSESLDHLRSRNESEALNAFVVALLQADSLGTPVGRILATQAAEARVRRRQAVREHAGKLPVRILVPTVLLIFPPTFVVLLGPAMASIRAAF